MNDNPFSGRTRRSVASATVGIALFASLLLSAGCGSSSQNVAVAPTSTARFRQANLVADTPGIAAHTDPNLINPWGISFSPTGEFWFSDNGTGLSTLYLADGTAQSLIVTIPAAGGGTGGTPTGTVFTGGAGFSGKPAFAFVSEDGVLTTWNGGATAAVLRADLSVSGAVFKGMALAPSATGANELFVTDFHNAKIDVFDTNYQPVTLAAGAFVDPAVPTGFAPFNIQNLGGSLYVTYARQDADAHDDVVGPGNGFVAIFRPDGTLVRHLVSNGRLNSPWGLALAPTGFGPYGDDLLVGNFGDGTINVYDPASGAFVGQLLDDAGKPLAIPELWGLAFGNGGEAGSTHTLFFTSGPGDESHGLFGSLTSE